MPRRENVERLCLGIDILGYFERFFSFDYSLGIYEIQCCYVKKSSGLIALLLFFGLEGNCPPPEVPLLMGN